MMSLIPGRVAWGRKATVALGAFFIATSAAVVPAVASVDPGTAPVIVGMGDSYTSGMGVRPYVGNAKCYRSASAYPLLAANALGYTGRNVACAGADTQDVGIDYNGDSSQIGQLNDPDWVVMTVGSNNVDLSGAVLQDEVSVSTMMSRIPKVGSSVEGVLTSVQKAAPNAEVILVNHPDVLPANASSLTCLGDKASSVDLANMHKAYAQFNAALKTAASNAKAIYVDTAAVFAGHDVCAKDPWFTGLDDPDAAFHLNLAGSQQVANLVVAAIKKVDGAAAPSTSSSTKVSTLPATVPPTTAIPTTATPTTVTVPPTTAAPTTLMPTTAVPVTTVPEATAVSVPTVASVDSIDSVVTDISTPAVTPTSRVVKPVAATPVASTIAPSMEQSETRSSVTPSTAEKKSEQPKSTSKSKWAKRHHRRHHCLGHKQRQWSFVQQDDAGHWAQ
jgi:hypothetical protein